MPYLIGASFVTLLGALGAQQVPSFKSGVDVVLIDVTMVDPTGRPVTDLRSEDFRITVNRKPRTIASATFIRYDTRTSVTALPEGSRATPTGSPWRGSVPAAMTRNVLIVIDTDSMEPGDGLLVRKAVKGFLDQLAPDDRVGVATVPWLKSEVELSRLRSGARKLLDSVIIGNERFRSGEFIIATRMPPGVRSGGTVVAATRLGTLFGMSSSLPAPPSLAFEVRRGQKAALDLVGELQILLERALGNALPRSARFP